MSNLPGYARSDRACSGTVGSLSLILDFETAAVAGTNFAFRARSLGRALSHLGTWLLDVAYVDGAGNAAEVAGSRWSCSCSFSDSGSWSGSGSCSVSCSGSGSESCSGFGAGDVEHVIEESVDGYQACRQMAAVAPALAARAERWVEVASMRMVEAEVGGGAVFLA